MYDFKQMEVARPCTKKRRKAQTHAPGHIARPPNMFFLWSREYRPQIAAMNPGVGNDVVSRELGKIWKGLAPEDKEQWRIKAEQAKLQHEQDYPDYKYQPRRRRERAPAKLSRATQQLFPPSSTGSDKHGYSTLKLRLESPKMIQPPPPPTFEVYDSSCTATSLKSHLYPFFDGNCSMSSTSDISSECDDLGSSCDITESIQAMEKELPPTSATDHFVGRYCVYDTSSKMTTTYEDMIGFSIDQKLDSVPDTPSLIGLFEVAGVGTRAPIICPTPTYTAVFNNLLQSPGGGSGTGLKTPELPQLPLVLTPISAFTFDFVQ